MLSACYYLPSKKSILHKPMNRLGEKPFKDKMVVYMQGCGATAVDFEQKEKTQKNEKRRSFGSRPSSPNLPSDRG
jgi:hypothetical protein